MGRSVDFKNENGGRGWNNILPLFWVQYLVFELYSYMTLKT